jgi:hypothetical protein
MITHIIEKSMRRKLMLEVDVGSWDWSEGREGVGLRTSD